MPEKLKNIPVKESIHSMLLRCAKERGMILQGLTERILRDWLDRNFFAPNIASGNKAPKK